MASKATRLPTFMSADLTKGEFKTLTSFAKSATSGGNESRFLGVIEGYASTPHVDREFEVISEKALATAADQLMKNSSVFFNHEHTGLPIGVVLDSKFLKDKGLFVRVGISKNFPDIWQSIEEGSLKHFSIAGRVGKGEVEEEQRLINGKTEKISVIKEIELWEVSVVGIPANPHAEFSLGEAIHKYLTLDEKNPVETTTESQVIAITKTIQPTVTPMVEQKKDEQPTTPAVTVDVTRQENEALKLEMKSMQSKMDEQLKKNDEEFRKMKELLETKEKITAKSILSRQTEQREDVPSVGHQETQQEFFEKAFRVPGEFDMDIYGTLKAKSFNQSPIRREYQKSFGGAML